MNKWFAGCGNVKLFELHKKRESNAALCCIHSRWRYILFDKQSKCRLFETPCDDTGMVLGCYGTIVSCRLLVSPIWKINKTSCIIWYHVQLHFLAFSNVHDISPYYHMVSQFLVYVLAFKYLIEMTILLGLEKDLPPLHRHLLNGILEIWVRFL